MAGCRAAQALDGTTKGCTSSEGLRKDGLWRYSSANITRLAACSCCAGRLRVLEEALLLASLRVQEGFSARTKATLKICVRGWASPSVSLAPSSASSKSSLASSRLPRLLSSSASLWIEPSVC